MILADTSIWIDVFTGALILSKDDFEELAICGPVVQEVLQGMRPSPASRVFRERMLALHVLSDPVSLDLFLSAAEIYRQGRRRGITIRSTIDCLIAAIAIENSIPVWHRDRDFDPIAQYTPLEVRAVRLQ